MAANGVAVYHEDGDPPLFKVDDVDERHEDVRVELRVHARQRRSAEQSGLGFPALAVPGQFLIKDVVLLGAALWTTGEALRAVQCKKM